MRQQPIDPKKRSRFESYIGWNQSWIDYCNQYKILVDKIVDQVENKITTIDTVSLPLLFLIRHSIELGLKANILKLEPVNSKIPKIELKGSKYHSIEVLFNKFKEHLDTLLKEKKVSQNARMEIKDYLKKFIPLTKVFHDLDKGSFSFRYPVDTDGHQNFDWNDRLQIADIIELYYVIYPFLLFTENVLLEEGVIEPERSID